MVLNGQKAWATNGGIANVHVVVASVDRELGSRGQAAFVIPPGTKGLEMGTKVRKHGLRASHTADVFLDDCRVPGSLPAGRQGEARRAHGPRPRGPQRQAPGGDADLRGQPPDGRRPGDRHRPRGYEYALAYAKERSQFGRPIIAQPGIAFTLADMKLEIDAARLLVWRASWMGRTGKPFTAAEGSMSKLKAGEVAVWATERAIQILGGNGYTREYPGRALAPRRQDLHDLRGHLGDPAARDRAGDLGRPDPVAHPEQPALRRASGWRRGSAVCGRRTDRS